MGKTKRRPRPYRPSSWREGDYEYYTKLVKGREIIQMRPARTADSVAAKTTDANPAFAVGPSNDRSCDLGGVQRFWAALAEYDMVLPYDRLYDLAWLAENLVYDNWEHPYLDYVLELLAAAFKGLGMWAEVKDEKVVVSHPTMLSSMATDNDQRTP